MDTRNTLNNLEAATYIGISPSTLAKWRMTGNGPCFVQAMRRVVYRRQDLDDWLAARVKHATSDRGGGAIGATA